MPSDVVFIQGIFDKLKVHLQTALNVGLHTPMNDPFPLDVVFTQGASDQLKVNVQTALNIGLSKGEIIEVIIH